MIANLKTVTRFRPVIRVFVSSTFSDLKAERNALQAQVFPRLEQLCAQNGFQFQAIDLRWGVSSEAGLAVHRRGVLDSSHEQHRYFRLNRSIPERPLLVADQKPPDFHADSDRSGGIP